MADTPSRQSFWQTVPGILTGTAALISAVTGLIVVFNHPSNRSEPVHSPSSTSDARGLQSRSTPNSRPSGGGVVSAGAKAIALPSLHQVKLGGGTAVVTLLSADVDTIDADRRSLTFRVRYMNAGRFGANFWTNSFRLLVDNVPREPTNSLDEVVDADSAKEGDVVFEVPMTAKDVVLQISSGDEKSRIRINLP